MESFGDAIYAAVPADGLVATVRAVEERSEGGFWVLVGESPFFPGGGGQAADRGWVDGQELVEVRRRDGIWALAVAEPPRGTRVVLRRDAERRRDLSVQHSAQHLISAVAWSLWTAGTLSVHLGEDESTVDLDMAPVEEARLCELEDEVLRWIHRAMPVGCTGTEGLAGRESRLRRPLPTPAEAGEARIVWIGDVDAVACCGTHVENTAELAPVRIVGQSVMRGRCRLHFLAGRRATERMRAETATLSALARMVNCSREDLEERCRGALAERDALRRRADALGDELLALRFGAESRTLSLGPAGPRLRVWSHEELPSKGLAAVAARLAALAGEPVCLRRVEGTRCSVALARPEGGTLDCCAVLRERLEAVGGRGGGNGAQAQGSMAAERWGAFWGEAEPEGEGGG